MATELLLSDRETRFQMDKQAQPEEKLQLGSVSSFHPIQSTPEAEDISFVIQPETVEDVLLKSRMRDCDKKVIS